MKRLLTALLILSLLAASSWGQAPKVIVIRGRVVNSIEDGLGCLPHPDDGVGNADLFNASILDTGQRNALYVPGKRFNVQETLVLTYTGRAIGGNGLSRLDGGNGWDVNRGPCSRIVWNKNVITFDGSTTTATTANDSTAVLTVSAGSVPAESLWQTLRITGGTNFNKGSYSIIGISGNTLTLDRDPSTGGAGSAMTGRIHPTVIRDEAYGTVYDGITIEGSGAFPYDSQTANSGNPSNRAAVLLQFFPDLEDDDVTFPDPGAQPNTSKASVNNVSIADGDVGFLMGLGVEAMNDVYDTDGVADTNCLSYGRSNSDHVRFDKILAQRVSTVFAFRSTQALGYKIDDVHCAKCPVIFRVDRGGKITAHAIYTTDNAPGNDSGPTLLHIGGAASGASVSTPIVIDGGTFDSPASNCKLVTMDGVGSDEGRIEIANFSINNPKVFDSESDGTAQAGAASTIQLASAETADHTGHYIRITHGTGAGQGRYIESYVVGTDTATVSVAWTVTPDATSRYSTYSNLTCGTAQGGTASTIQLASAETVDHATDFVRITGGAGRGQERYIESYVVGTDTATVNVPWAVIPDTTSTYEAFEETSIVTGNRWDIETPAVTVKDGFCVTLRNVEPITPGFVRLEHNATANTFRPRVLITGCTLYGPEGDEDQVIDNPDVVLDKDNSQIGTEVSFVGNVGSGWSNVVAPPNDRNDYKFCREGVYVIGSGWKAPNAYELDERVDALENP